MSVSSKKSVTLIKIFEESFSSCFYLSHNPSWIKISFFLYKFHKGALYLPVGWIEGTWMWQVYFFRIQNVQPKQSYIQWWVWEETERV